MRAICGAGHLFFILWCIKPLLVLDGVDEVNARSPCFMLPLPIAERRKRHLVAQIEYFLNAPATLIVHAELVLVLIQLVAVFSLLNEVFGKGFKLAHADPHIFLHGQTDDAEGFFGNLNSIHHFWPPFSKSQQGPDSPSSG